jgi:ABC-2 type transport system ATP-binding protein
VTDAVIAIAGLQKRYGSVEALRGLDLQVAPGSICGFLGRNGAGKTTTMKVLMGMVAPTAGSAQVFGLDPSDPVEGTAIRRRVGFVSDDKDLYDGMSVDALINFTAGFFPKWNADVAAAYQRRFALPGRQRVARLSRGMRTKLALLLAFSRDAGLLLLDEATSGLDPAAAEDVLQADRRTGGQRRNHGLLFLPPARRSRTDRRPRDRHRQGRAVLSGALDDIRDQYRRVRLVFEGDAPVPSFETPGVVRVRREGRVLTVLASSGADAIVAEARTLSPIAVDVAPTTLKEIFLDSVGAATSGVEA